MDQTDLSLFKRRTDKSEKTDDVSNQCNSISNSEQVQHEKHRIISRPTREDEYHTDNPHVGIALIFNHENIGGERQREGVEKNCDAMQRTLLNYGFDVRVFNDLTFEELSDVLREIAYEDHSNNDCLLVTVISNDSDVHYPIEFLWNSFLGEKCETLINKPKLFFIQARRSQNVSFFKKSIQFMRPKPKPADKPHNITYVIPNTADILIMFSTFEKYSSIRNFHGSWFIQSLCSVLNDASTNEAVSEKGAELLRLLTAVNRKTAYDYQSFSKKKEMPNFLSTLTKTFYLKVKNRNN